MKKLAMNHTRNPLSRNWLAAGALGLSLALSACGSDHASFSLLADNNDFKQSASVTNGKIDVLWIVDNSGSMESSQKNVADNFARFIELFNAKGYDYRLAVITSDSYKVLFTTDQSRAKFKDGTNHTKRTGVFVVEPTTPNVHDTFLTNVLQGIYGSGDERVFQSMEVSLKHQLNAEFDFPRKDAFLAIINVSDEDDFSHDGSSTIDGQYSNANLHKVDRYVAFLDGLTGATASNRSSKYNFNTISVLDSACKTELETTFKGRKIAYRYMELADKTGGLKGSLCGNFGTTLADISNKIVELSTQFFLNGEPDPTTIQVSVNGQSAPRLEGTEPAPWDGYVYHPDTNSITFHGSWVPASGASISVTFDPVALK